MAGLSLSEENTLGYNSGVEHGAVLCKREALSESILESKLTDLIDAVITLALSY